MDFSELLRAIDQAIAAKNNQQVIDLCNQGIEQFNYSLLLAEKRGNARFNLKLYEEALVDFHNVLEAGINANECRLKICIINSKLIQNAESLSKENYPLLRQMLIEDPTQKALLEAVFSSDIVSYVASRLPNEGNTEAKEINGIDDPTDIAFDPVMYRKFNRDLWDLSDEELLKHYTKAGIFEQRVSSKSSLRIKLKNLQKQAPEGFNLSSYRLLNPDLRKQFDSQYFGKEKELEYASHFMNAGLREKRDYQFPAPTQFDPNQFGRRQSRNQNLQQFLASGRKIKLSPSLFSKPIISFIVPVFGKFDSLLNLLLSLESQIDQRFEVIIYDNATQFSEKKQFYSQIQANIIYGDKNLHYLSACNHASSQAKGTLLVFLKPGVELNVDTASQLIESFKANPKLGVLGGKVLHQNQLVQELGGTIFSDAFNRGIGRNFGPNAFWLSFPRKVDYISASCLATRKDVFLELGKFDELFMPTYYEDLDYCVRVAQRGLEVLADPRLEITHDEGAGQDDPEEDIKLQAANRRQFLEKHALYLQNQQPADHYQEAGLKAAPHFDAFKKRVLYIDDALPDPKFGNGFGRAKDIIDTLLEHDCFVTHVSTSNIKNLSSNIDAQYQIDGKQVEFIKFCSFDEIACILDKRPDFYDDVIVSRKHNIEYYLSYFRNFLGNAKVIFDVEALFTLRDFINQSELSFAEIDYEAYKNTPEFQNEIELFKYADVIWFASRVEKLLCESATQNTKPLFEVGHQVNNIARELIPFEQREGIVFLGSVPEPLSPNVDSIQLLLNEIIPGLRASSIKEPFYFIGNIEVQEVEDEIKAYCLKDENTHYLGLVDDPANALSRAKVFVTPTRVAAGIPHKLTMPAEFGVPIVTSELIGQQIHTKDSFKYCRTIDEFIYNIKDLCSNESSWNKGSKEVLNYVRKELNRKNYEPAFKSLIS